MSEERRQAQRQKSLLRGLAYLGNSPSAMNCLVRDISDGGARLKFGGPINAPDTLDLHIPVRNQTLRCKVKWREVDEIGVGFMVEAGTATAPAAEEDLAARVERLEGEIAQFKQMIKKLTRSNAASDAA